MRPESAVIEGEREGRIIEVLMRCQVGIGGYSYLGTWPGCAVVQCSGPGLICHSTWNSFGHTESTWKSRHGQLCSFSTTLIFNFSTICARRYARILLLS